MSNEPDLLKPDAVTDNELQTELGNLKAENETLKANYATLLESSGDIVDKLRGNVRELRSQLETERTDREEIETELSDLKQNSSTAREFPDAVNLTKKAGELLSLFKSLLPPKEKLPNGTISKIKKILEG